MLALGASATAIGALLIALNPGVGCDTSSPERCRGSNTPIMVGIPLAFMGITLLVVGAIEGSGPTKARVTVD